MARNKSKKEGTILQNHVDDVYGAQKIHPYDGYVGEPIFKPSEISTYYDVKTDRQCTVPIRSISEVKKELGL